MSGHSKWATIKRKKGANDAARGKLFAKLIRQVEVAARTGGNSDPDMNAPLADAIQRAKDKSVPKDTIERAAKRGGGELDDAADWQVVMYEGYGPAGVAVLVDCLTDNRNRTASDVRAAFTKTGGNLAEPGAVAFMFSRRGRVELEGADEDDIMMVGMDHGLEDVEVGAEAAVAWCQPTDVKALRAAFVAAGMKVTDSDSPMVPSVSVPIEDVTDARKILRLLDLLEDSDDVQNVYANFDASDEVLEAASAE